MCRPRAGGHSHEAWRHTEAKAMECAKEGSLVVPAYKHSISRFAGGAPEAEDLQKPGPQARPSYSYPASFSDEQRPGTGQARSPSYTRPNALRNCAPGTEQEETHLITQPVCDLARSGCRPPALQPQPRPPLGLSPVNGHLSSGLGAFHPILPGRP